MTATLSDVSAGTAEICLWVGTRDDVQRRTCRDVSENGTLTARTNRTGPTSWTVSLIGTEGGVAPSVTLVLGFRAEAPSVLLQDFRFQGTAFPGYNGFTAVVVPRTAGTMSVDAQLRDGSGGEYPYRLRVVAEDGGEDEVTETGSTVSYQAPVTRQRYRVDLENTQEVVNAEVFIRAEISWP